MTQVDDLQREIEGLRSRLSRLSEATLRINDSLNFDTVLQEVLDSACSLSGARYGLLILLHESGRIRNFLSSGLTPEQTRLIRDLPEGKPLIDYLKTIPGPLRVSDLHGHIRSLGLPDFRPPMPVSDSLSFLAAPVRHGGEVVGSILLGEKEGRRKFSPEDEETLVMFASQAALVIANARRYREEQRARSGLEALINTSPVGVVVFDAKTGEVASINREARRIVGDLHSEGGSAEQLLDVLTFRRADGREISLDEFPLAKALSTGETVRAEEIVVQVPDGRSVTTLVNATPIQSEEGRVESVVVTLQDMTPVEELERLRSEFLGMVGHELRTPLTSIKGSAATLLEAGPSLDPAEMLQFHRIINEQADYMRDLISDLIDMARIETGTLSVAPAPAEAASLIDEARSTFLSGGSGNDIRVDMARDLPLVMADRRRILQVLGNLLSNAARYSPEASTIRVDAVLDGVHVRHSRDRRGQGRAGRAAAAPVQEVHPARRRGEGPRPRRLGPGASHLQGHSRGPWGPHLGRERRTGLGGALHLYDSSGEGGHRGRSRVRAELFTSQSGEAGEGDHPGGGRRSADAAVRPRRPIEGGIHSYRHRRPGGRLPAGEGQPSAPGPVGPDAAGDRRGPPDEGDLRDLRRAHHVPVGLRPGRGDRQGLRDGRRRLRRQALLAKGACGEDQSGAAPADGAGPGRAAAALRAGRPDGRVRRAHGEGGRRRRCT